MKVCLINETDISGGAARATYRLHKALQNFSIDSELHVNHKLTDDWTVHGPTKTLDIVKVRAKLYLAKYITKLCKTNNPILHSPAIFNSKWPTKINNLNSDIVHLNWINGEMMSIADISRINKPLVWTMHDMWPFCGAEHITDFSERYKIGYFNSNRPSDEAGFDLNKYIWNKKLRYWNKPINIIAPSEWMAQCVKNSFLMKNWDVKVIPNTLDTDFWTPIDKYLSRNLLNLPSDVPLIAFGALGTNQYHKGFDLLFDALKILKDLMPDIEIVIFGESKPKIQIDFGFPVHYLGHITDDLVLKIIYNSVDVMVVPSRTESFGQTASEAQACGTPVVCFDVCGLKDIVLQEITGYLVKAFNTEELAKAIYLILNDELRLKEMSINSRKYAIKKFSNDAVIDLILSYYKKIIDNY